MKTYTDISLHDRNTFGIRATARRLVEIEPGDEVPRINGPMSILGAGSNVVFLGDYGGTLVTLADRDAATATGDTVTAWGGMRMDNLIQWTLDHGLYGLENLSAIPGTVGASAVQNVGAYGLEAKDVIERVEAFDLESRRHITFTNADCGFGYRHSHFKQFPNRYLILRVCYRLSPTFTPNLGYKALEDLPHSTAQQLRDAIADLRWQKLPRPEEHGSAGSFFKNPVVDEETCRRLKEQHPDMPTYPGGKLSAGWLIDRAGWKGRTEGRVGVWPRQALVLYNLGGCDGQEVLHLARAVQASVERRFGITLEPEAIFI
ncbi:MAG: UDP-N-acetylmuramate dehydrogenase [Bacteroidales bacterium]|nr:UDP-N-acetylmuramate dehydrogenase [Bacteroidales bacterium]